jgi:hypothetical protein
MTTKVVVYNEGPNNVAVDNGEEIKVVHPGARESQYVYKGKTLTIFEVEAGDGETT